MAHTKSARKRIRQDSKRQQRNQAVKTGIRTLTKKFRSAAEGPDQEQTTKALKETVRALDKAASRGVLHRRTASRKASRLAKAANRRAAASAPDSTASAS